MAVRAAKEAIDRGTEQPIEEGLEIEAIANRLGTSPTSTRRLLGRAALRLGERLGDAGDAS